VKHVGLIEIATRTAPSVLLQKPQRGKLPFIAKAQRLRYYLALNQTPELEYPLWK
jgi:hypothetical protein